MSRQTKRVPGRSSERLVLFSASLLSVLFLQDGSGGTSLLKLLKLM